MFYRYIFAFLLFFSPAASASGALLYPLNDSVLLESAKEISRKNYAAAKDIALKAQQTGIKDFLLGVTAYRLEQWDDAAASLGKSLEGFHLLADFSLYYRADSLCHLGRYDEALATLQKLKKDCPQSPLIRSASFLYADSLFNKKDYAGALSAYQKYVESYPSGSTALKAIFQAALCREALGDKERAANELRRIWLRYPDSPLSAQAESNLQRLKSDKVRVPPYTTEEIFNRGVVLYDLQKYRQALETFTSLSAESLPEKFKTRLALKIGQTLFRSRHYKDAEQALVKLTTHNDAEIACEAAYWLARTYDRTGNERQAVALYSRVAEAYPQSELADDALFHAAQIKKFRGEYGEAVAILEKLVSRYPSSVLVSRAIWETAWNRYLTKDFKGAADSLARLVENPPYREQALYWLARAKDASGEKDQANTIFARLMEEYPYGFYSMRYQNKAGIKNGQFPVPGSEAVSSFPVPSGYDRAKALITFGLIDEAGMELTACKKKAYGRSRLLELARLYWEIQDYRSAMGLFIKVDRNSSYTWNFSYPKAFSEHVSHYADSYKVPQSLAYSIIRAESNFFPSALSPAGAVGLMQVMPTTAKLLHKDKSGKIDASQLTHPELNINLGMKHVKDLFKRYDGNLIFTIAAYNSGSTPVDRWRKSFPALQDDEFIENIPYPETREYVKNVLTSMEIYRSLYGLDGLTGKAAATTSAQSPSASGLALSSPDTKETGGKNLW